MANHQHDIVLATGLVLLSVVLLLAPEHQPRRLRQHLNAIYLEIVGLPAIEKATRFLQPLSQLLGLGQVLLKGQRDADIQMLSMCSVSAAQAETYYEKDDYYTAGTDAAHSTARWYGQGASTLGLQGEVKPEDFKALLHGTAPTVNASMPAPSTPPVTGRPPTTPFQPPRAFPLPGWCKGIRERSQPITRPSILP
jgi:hypothetical protein